jgi:benzodiazapine receptor
MNNTMDSIKVLAPLKLVLSILICQSAGLIGAVFTSASISTWYVTLNKPFFTPPNWLFAPVWLTLYTLMGVAAFLVWQHGFQDPQVKRAVSIFGVQLILNALWSGAFFGLQSPLAGFIVIVVLWIAILATILKFFAISKTAGLLLIPYILWVSLAAALNGALVILN